MTQSSAARPGPDVGSLDDPDDTDDAFETLAGQRSFKNKMPVSAD
jgi:hypothetical protein